MEGEGQGAALHPTEKDLRAWRLQLRDSRKDVVVEYRLCIRLFNEGDFVLLVHIPFIDFSLDAFTSQREGRGEVIS